MFATQMNTSASGRSVRNLLASLALVAGVLLLAAGPVRAAEPAQIIEDSSERLLDGLKNRSSEFNANEAALLSFLRDEIGGILDSSYTGRLVLGRHSRGADEVEVTAFAEALQENLLRRYGTALLTVDPNIAVRVLSSREMRDGAIVQVRTEISRPSGSPIGIDYLFRERNGTWRAFDVVVEGVSYVQTFRNQFDPLVREKGIAGVTADLREGRIDVDPEV